MTRYCLEFGSDASANAIVHELNCENFDHGTLLGEGRLGNLGEFDCSKQALDAARLRQPGAVRCLTCCISGLVEARRVQAQAQPKASAPPLPVNGAPWSPPHFAPEKQEVRSVRPH